MKLFVQRVRLPAGQHWSALQGEQYKAVKNAKMNKPFKIKNKEVAKILQVIGVVKPEEIKVSKAIITEDDFIPAAYKPTGMYLLQLRGD